MDNDSDVRSIRAIDVHAHYGPYLNSPHALNNRFMSGGPGFVLRCARQANTEYSIVSPMAAFMPRGTENDAVAANEDAFRVVAAHAGLLQWVVIDPRRRETFEQAERMLKTPRCVGIKMHPEEHVYHVGEQGRPVFEFAARHGAVILSHSGQPNSLPADLVALADAFPEVRLILAHLGNGDGDPTLQVRAIGASRHGNVFADTSSGASVMPQLIEWAVGEVGPEPILYGTDVTCHFSPVQRARIDHAHISDDAKRLILRENALKLIGPLP